MGPMKIWWLAILLHSPTTRIFIAFCLISKFHFTKRQLITSKLTNMTQMNLLLPLNWIDCLASYYCETLRSMNGRGIDNYCFSTLKIGSMKKRDSTRIASNKTKFMLAKAFLSSNLKTQFHSVNLPFALSAQGCSSHTAAAPTAKWVAHANIKCLNTNNSSWLSPRQIQTETHKSALHTTRPIMLPESGEINYTAERTNDSKSLLVLVEESNRGRGGKKRLQIDRIEMSIEWELCTATSRWIMHASATNYRPDVCALAELFPHW